MDLWAARAVAATFGPAIIGTHMPASSSHAGMIKWLGPDERGEPFDNVLWLHMGPACEPTGIKFEDIFGPHHAKGPRPNTDAGGEFAGTPVAKTRVSRFAALQAA